MTPEEMDRLLSRRLEAEQRIAESLVEIEAHPAYLLLTSAPHRGVTRDRLDPVLQASTELWRAFTSFQRLLAEAKDVRGDGRRPSAEVCRRVEELLTGSAILIDVERLPLDERSLMGPRARERHVSVDELLAQMERWYEVVGDAVAAVDRKQRELLPGLEAAQATLADVEARAQSLGISDEPALVSLRGNVSDVLAALSSDPLGIPENAAAGLDAVTATARERIETLERGHATLEADIGAAGDLLAGLRRLRSSATEEAEAARVKIVGARTVEIPGLDVLDGADGLAERLASALAVGGDWRRQRRALDSWYAQARSVEEGLSGALVRIREQLVRRDELRGLLSAYVAKAAGTDRAEESAVSALAREAHEELYGAPCDLDRAGELVAELGDVLRTTGGKA